MYLSQGTWVVTKMKGTDTVSTRTKVSSSPPLPKMFARYKESLLDHLKGTIPSPERTVDDWDQLAGLYTMVEYHMGWTDPEGRPVTILASQGKALRPVLCLFASEALGGDWLTALPAASSLELIHNFSLIHDDIQDKDVERRHQATVWYLWGESQALVAGNTIRSLADICALDLSERGVPKPRALYASQLLTSAYLEMTQGQCLDLAYEDRLDIGLKDYLNMVSLKTGALIRCSMEMGALITTPVKSHVEAYAMCGEFLGMAFQIQDDVLGIWGDEASTGKAVGNDIRRKKKSFPIVYALETAKGGARQRLVDSFSKEELDDEDVESVLRVLEALGADDHAQKMASERAELALEQARKVPMQPWAAQEIEELVEFLTKRQH